MKSKLSTITKVLALLMAIPMITSVIVVGYSNNATAASDADTVCRAGQVLVWHYNRNSYICTSESGAEMWIRTGQAEYASQEAEEAMEEVTEESMDVAGEAMEEEAMEEVAEEAMEEKPMEEVAEEAMEETMEEAMEEKPMEAKSPHEWQTATGTLESMQDPGIGHETHQLAIILPPSEKTYKGILSYDASEPIQLVALHGPLAEGEDSGQAIWTPDGETKFALTFVDPKNSMGTWLFSGNALAVHTMNEEQFTVSYSVVASEN